ncbi:MAG TPA: MogA/MoaB family molybdenum cofactor biosynthesis protein, partial [Deltaproteobacteria bacterium]|nr:MogA/MoaB family molybdenum cofactor biosynthesis protein [Deltaproteobacteria bacterium]
MQKVFLSGVLTVSDKGSAGLREDESGKIVAEMLKAEGFQVAKKEIVPDDRQKISERIIQWIDQDGLSLVITSGGTGLSPTDVTPQAMEKIIDYQIPGIPEAMRAASLLKTPHAMISRAMAGVRGTSLVINLPGSPGGARDNLSVVLPAL